MLGLKLFECLFDILNVISQYCCVSYIVCCTSHSAEFILFSVLVFSSMILHLRHCCRRFRTIPLDCLCHIDVAWLNPSEQTFLHFNARDHVLPLRGSLALLLRSVFASLGHALLRRLAVNQLGGDTILWHVNSLVVTCTRMLTFGLSRGAKGTFRTLFFK